MSDQTEIKIFASKPKSLLIVIMLIGMLALAWFTANTNPTTVAEVKTNVYGIILLIISIFLLPLSLKQLFAKIPQVIIGQKGIIVGTRRIVPWRKIESIHAYKGFRAGNTISLTLRDAKPSVELSASLLDMDFDELVELVTQYRKKYGLANRPNLSASSKRRPHRGDHKRHRPFQTLATLQHMKFFSDGSE